MKRHHCIAAVLVLCALFGVTLWRVWPRSPIYPEACAHPVGLRIAQRRVLRLCLRGPTEPLADLLRRTNHAACPGDRAAFGPRSVRAGQLIMATSAGCGHTVRDLPAGLALTFGLGLDVNSATEHDLRALPGVGPVLAGRIVAHRRVHGRFAEPDDMLQVKGIGKATLRRIGPLIHCRPTNR